MNAEEVEEEVSTMWRTMYKLTKSFSDVPGPRRIADSVKTKIDKFKAYLPLLHTICNPGIRDRHWEQVSTVDTRLSNRKQTTRSLTNLKNIKQNEAQPSIFK